MKEFKIVPKIIQCSSFMEFLKEFQLGDGDLVLTSRSVYYKYLSGRIPGSHAIFCKDYGTGEPTDAMVEKIHRDIKDLKFKRIIAIGGGTILDISKLLTLKKYIPVAELFDGRMKIERIKELILIPTTCGTGSEVTNISVLEIMSKNTKMGLAADALYGDYAVLIPELLSTLPMKYFATSSIDALIHAVEAYTSPKANSFSRMYSMQAIKLILTGYRRIEQYGEEERFRCMAGYLTASAYAGIAFGNAGCAAVHALSYPLGAAYHIPHGEANYAMFTQVYKTYQRRKPEGRINELNNFLSKILDCDPAEVYDEMEKLLNIIIPKKALREYGVTKEDISGFTEAVMTRQTRLMKNNYTELDRETVKEIYYELM